MGPSEDFRSATKLTGSRKQGDSQLGPRGGSEPRKTPLGPSLCRQDSPPTPWALQASFAGTAARAVEGGGAGVVYTLLSGTCSPLFLALQPALPL